MSPHILRLCVFILPVAALTLTGCQTTHSEYRVLSERSDRKVAQLDNGLVVIAQHTDAAPVASVQCWVKTGSVYEGEYNGSGLSHFLEHLISGGTTATRSEDESSQILGRIGARTNAATSLDTVRYYIDTSAEHAVTAVDLVSDWMQNSLITQEEYEREQQVIRREFAMGRGEPGRIFWKLTQQARYQNHPARHPTIGYEDEFLQVTRDAIYDFYKTMYVPNNMVFVVSGDVDPQKMIDEVAARWKDTPRGDLPEIELPIEKPIDEPRDAVGEASVDRPRLRLAWPGVRLTTEHDYALDLLMQVLGQGELSRLVQTVRDEKQLVTSIDAYNYSATWGEGFLGVDAQVNPDQIDAAKQAILEQVEKIKAEGVTEDELARAKRKTVSSVMFSAQTAHAIGSRLASDFINTGDPDYLARYADAIQHVTAEQVKTAANKFLLDERLITIKLLPLTGEKAGVLTRTKEDTPPAEKTETVDLDNRSLVQRMMKLDKTRDAMVGEIHEPTMITLDNGLRVVIQRNNRLPIVAMQWYHLGGLLADEAGREGIANATSRMMTRGAAGKSADEIARVLESLGASIDASCGNSTHYVQARSLAEDWPAVMDLMADVIIEPDFPAEEWSRMKPRLLAAIDSQNDVWYSQLRNALRRSYFGENHPWSQPTIGRRQVVEGLTADTLKKFHADHLGAKDGVLAIVGDVDPQAVTEAVKKHFGKMPAQAPKPFEKKPHDPVKSRIVQESTRNNMVAMDIAYGPGLARNNPDYAPMLVMNRVLDTFPVGWFAQALRGEGPGLVYAVGSGISTGVIPGYWAVLFNTQPDTAAEAMDRTLKVVDRIRNEKVDADTLNRAREAALVSEASGQQSNAQLASGAALMELYGVGYDAGDQLIEQLHAVTADDIHRVANEYLKNPLAVIVTPSEIDESKLPKLR